MADLGHGNKKRAEAINRCTRSEARCISVSTNIGKYHTDYPPDNENLKEAVEWADIIHQTDTHPWILGLDKLPNFVQEFRGGYLRMYSRAIWNWQVKTKHAIITTPELGRFVPRFHFIPIPMDMAKFVPAEGWPETELPLDVLQTPTRRDYKDTDLLVETCEKVEGVRLRLVENLPLEEAIEAKRDADLYFGDIQSGDYGSNEREAAAYGTAVIGRLQPIARAYNINCPIIDVNNAAELRKTLEGMVKRPEKVAELKEATRTWAAWFLSYESVGPRMDAFYRYVLCDDDNQEAWERFSGIWKEVARVEHKITEFVNPMDWRW